MVLIPQVQCIRKASLYKILWMNIPVVSGPDKSSRMRLQSSECLALTSGTFFFLGGLIPFSVLPWWQKPPPQMTPDCTDQASDSASDMGTTHSWQWVTPEAVGWHHSIACRFYLSLLIFLWWKTLCPLYYIIVAITTNQGMESQKFPGYWRLNMELLFFFFGLSAQVNNLDQTLTRMLNDDSLVSFLCKM